MRALITGGAGFIGSHLADELLRRGGRVIVYDDFSTGKYENIAQLEGRPDFELVTGDILDEPLLEKFVERCDVVYHLAAAVGVELIVKNPWKSLITNIRGSEILFKAAHRYRKKTLITSSSEIYGKNANAPLKEEDDRILGSPLKSRWAYSTSKAVAEILAYNYWKEKRLPVIIARLFNVVGPRQTGAYGMVIPRFVSQALRGDPLTVFGPGDQTRCFLHVIDTVEALIGLMECPAAVGEVVNVGSQEEITIEDLARKVISLVGNGSTLSYTPYDQAYEAGFEDMPRRVPDTAKAARLIGFKVTRDLDGIIRDVIEYCRANP